MLPKDFLSALHGPPPLSVYFPLSLPFIQVNDFVKDAWTGFKLSTVKRKKEKRQIKDREVEKRFIRVL